MKVRGFNPEYATFWKVAKDANENIRAAGRGLQTGNYSLILAATDEEESYVNCALSINSTGVVDPDGERVAKILALALCDSESAKCFGRKVFMRYVENVDLETLRKFRLMIETRLMAEGEQ